MILGIFITICLEILLPVLTGLAIALSLGDGRSKLDLLAHSFTYGQIILYAIFQPVFVFSILKDLRFHTGVTIFIILMGIIVMCMLTLISKYRKDLVKVFKSKNINPGIWGAAAIALLALMIVMSFIMTYYDGDDSFYVAAAAEGFNSDSMYKKEPYTGYAIESPYRYLFAPFPMWIAFLSGLSGIPVSAMAHTFLPWSMILLCFAVMYIMSGYLFGNDSKKRGVFMFFTGLLIIFGDYSIHTPENFLLARSRQGKAALCSFVLPFLIALIYACIKEYDQTKKIRLLRLAMITVTGFAGALCSTLGGVLCLSLTLTGALCMMLTYRKIKYPVLMSVFSMPSLVFVLLYFVMS